MRKYWFLKGFNENMDSLKREALNGFVYTSNYRREYVDNSNNIFELCKKSAKQMQIFHAFARVYLTSEKNI